MSLAELRAAVSHLSSDELAAFAQWLREFMDESWDRSVEEDVRAGRLGEAGRRADADFNAGRCQPL
jgi:hypothetical protein